MKFLLLPIFIFFACTTQLYAVIVSPNLGQTQYRWRNDNGSETAATWRAAVNTPITITDVNDVIRLRIELANTGTDIATVTETLEYSANGGTTWTVMNNPATNAFIYQTSTFVTNGAATTNQMGTGTPGTFAAGRIVTAPATATTLANGGRTEYEWVIKPTANIVPATTYTFRSSGQQATPTVYPTLTMSNTACTGMPTAGTTNAAAVSVPCGTTTQLSLTGNSISTGISFQWQLDTNGTWTNFGTNASTQTTPPVVKNTQYRCVLTCTNTGGGISQSVPVAVGPQAIPVNIGNDTTICPGITYTLNPGNPGASYLWSTNATTQTITVNQAGIYSVLVTLANGCTGSDSRTVTPGVVPQNNLAATTDLCEGETATLNAGNSGSTFSWTPGGATTQTLNVTTGGTKSVAIKSTTGCIINSSTNVIMRPLPVVDLGNDTSICNGAQITLDAGNPGHAFVWSPSGATTQTLTAADSGTYSVMVTTSFGCESEDEKHIAYLPAPYVEGFNFIPLFFENLGKVKFQALGPTSVISYLWNFGDGSPTSTLVSPTHTYPASGIYTATLKVFNGCGDYETSLSINVDNITGVVTLENNEADVVLFPNPSSNILTIDNRSTDLKMKEITIFNVLGAIVYKNAVTGNRNEVAVGQLASGIYSVRILTSKGYVIRKFEVHH